MKDITCASCHHWRPSEPSPVQLGRKEQALVIQENLAAGRAADLGKVKEGVCRRYPPVPTLIVGPHGLMGPIPIYPGMRETELACGEYKVRVEQGT